MKNSFEWSCSPGLLELYERVNIGYKLVMLDDDPTGIQTLNGVNVYTRIDEESIRNGFLEDNNLFVILTNSRSLQETETRELHEKIIHICNKLSEELNVPYMVISRSDSTLRGHFPLETNVICDGLQREVDGIVFCPFFLEGNRYTLHNEHYIKTSDGLIRASDSEFARDKTFSYKNSNLKEYVKEKYDYKIADEKIKHIDIDLLRDENLSEIKNIIMSCKERDILCVDALCYDDLIVFVTALFDCINEGKYFVIRSAASIVRIMAKIKQKPLLERNDLSEESNCGGLIIVGSHTNKTNQQIEKLRTFENVVFHEFKASLIFDEVLLKDEMNSLIDALQKDILDGKTVVLFTERVLIYGDNPENSLKISTKISSCISTIVKRLNVRPRFIIAKGGITSSDIGTISLDVKKAAVLGQAAKGVPVWKCDAGSKYPGLAYVIFPGNVGDENTLKEIVEKVI